MKKYKRKFQQELFNKALLGFPMVKYYLPNDKIILSDGVRAFTYDLAEVFIKLDLFKNRQMLCDLMSKTQKDEALTLTNNLKLLDKKTVVRQLQFSNGSKKWVNADYIKYFDNKSYNFMSDADDYSSRILIMQADECVGYIMPIRMLKEEVE